jgi:hypothetical protein
MEHSMEQAMALSVLKRDGLSEVDIRTLGARAEQLIPWTILGIHYRTTTQTKAPVQGKIS